MAGTTVQRVEISHRCMHTDTKNETLAASPKRPERGTKLRAEHPERVLLLP